MKIYNCATNYSLQLLYQRYIQINSDIVKQYNSIHTPIKIKPVDLDLIHVLIFQCKKPKFKVGDHAQILKYKNFQVINQLGQKTFCYKNVKDEGSWTYVIEDLNGEEFNGTFHDKEA